MKIFYLSKGNLVRDYYLDSGEFLSHREVICNDEGSLIDKLKGKISRQRKTNLYVVSEGFSNDTIKNIKKLFSNSKVKVSLEKRANLD